MPLPIGEKWLVWNKEQVMPSYSDCELAWTNIEGASVKMFTLHCNKARTEMGMHPTQKPLALIVWCLRVAKVPIGATVLDPYMGSGTTGVACLRTGRNFIGIEIDPKHYQTSCERMAKETDGNLF